MNEDIDKYPKENNKDKHLLRKIIIIVVAFILFDIVLFKLISLQLNNNDSFLEELKDKGFSDLNEKFVCDAIKRNSDLIMSTREYSVIAIDGEVYNISFNTKFENDQNCEKRGFETKITSHLDNIVIGENGKYYSVYENLLEKNDVKFNYDVKDVVQKVDNYILKKDGNIYYQQKSNGKLKLKYKASSLKGKIQNMGLINSDYSETDERKIIVVTNKAIYYSYSENEEKCRKYDNIECNYELKKDKFLSKYRNKILYIDDAIIITKTGKVLYTNNYFNS